MNVSVVAPEPSMLQFETATSCNASCTFCPRSKMKRRGKASWSQLVNIFQEIVPYIDSVVPFWMQEPLLEPRLTAILDNIKQANLRAKTTLFTNMNAMTKRQAQEIIDNQLLDFLFISFYGPTKQLYNELQPPLNWHKTKANIKFFMKYRRKQGFDLPIVTLHCLAIPQLTEKLDLLINEWQNVVDNIGPVHYDTIHGDMSNLKDDEEYWMQLGHTPEKARTPCPRLWTSMIITCDGDVAACCIDYEPQMVMGNVHEEDWREIWNGPKFQQLRKMHLEGRFDEIPLCQSCGLWRYEHPAEWNKIWNQNYAESGKLTCQKT